MSAIRIKSPHGNLDIQILDQVAEVVQQNLAGLSVKSNAILTISRCAWAIPLEFKISASLRAFSTMIHPHKGDVLITPDGHSLLLYVEDSNHVRPAVLLGRLSDEEVKRVPARFAHLGAGPQAISLELADAEGDLQVRKTALLDIKLPELSKIQILQVMAALDGLSRDMELIVQMCYEQRGAVVTLRYLAATRTKETVNLLRDAKISGLQLLDLEQAAVALEHVANYQELLDKAGFVAGQSAYVGRLAADLASAEGEAWQDKAELVDGLKVIVYGEGEGPEAPKKSEKKKAKKDKKKKCPCGKKEKKECKEKVKKAPKLSHKKCKHGYYMDECVCKIGKKASQKARKRRIALEKQGLF